MNCRRMAHILPTRWNVDFALVNERRRIEWKKQSYELGGLISKLQLGDDEMSIKTYIKMEGKEKTKLKLSTGELVDATLGPNSTQD